MGFKLAAAATILIVSISVSLYPTTPQAQWLPRRTPPHPHPHPHAHPHPHPHPLPALPLPDSPQPLCVSQLALVNRACGRLPYAQVPPPAPPAPGDHHHNNNNNNNHDEETAEEEECCRWLKEVDTVCVCDLLVHLPTFMTRPIHEYKVIVDDTCNVSFSCSSKL